jgi:hypothetical protein
MAEQKLVCPKGCKKPEFFISAIEHHTVRVDDNGSHMDSLECYDYTPLLGVGDTIECSECGSQGKWEDQDEGKVE